jgi:hypothetical protein
MDVIPSDNNVELGRMSRKAAQPATQDETLKSPEKTEAGSAVQQTDKVEIKSVLPKKEETGIQSFNQQDVQARNEQMTADMKALIINPDSHALEAQAGHGRSFLLSL